MPMTRRTLKKLSKQAAPFLVKYFGRSENDVFPATKGENYHGLIVRCTCRPRRYPLFGCDCRDHPLKGTPMTGEVSGYYEPEWSERTAWDELNDAVFRMDRPSYAAMLDMTQRQGCLFDMLDDNTMPCMCTD